VLVFSYESESEEDDLEDDFSLPLSLKGDKGEFSEEEGEEDEDDDDDDLEESNSIINKIFSIQI
jgi:hypothetical protein